MMAKSDDKNRFDISVRALAEHVHRTGGLSPLTFSGISGAEGTRLHTRVFNDLKNQYQPSSVETEVTLSKEIAFGDLLLSVKGRADCVIHQIRPGEMPEITLIEIKSTSGSFTDISEILLPVHWAQAMLYAHLYFEIRRDLAGFFLSLRYVSIETMKFVEEKKWVKRDEAAAFFAKTCDTYIAFAKDLVRYRKERDESITALSFPYPNVRPGQKAFMHEVVSAISHISTLFVEAPTGIGKTISTLFPAVKSLGHRKCDKIFYLTAKTATRSVAEKALSDLREKGLVLRSITLQAKEGMCPCPEMYCDTKQCAYAADYYTKLPAAINVLLMYDEITPALVIKTALKFKLCPHELSLDISLLCDVVIGDYNHAFNPRVKLDRYFNQPEMHHALLIDEAHNLVDRSRDMFSAALTFSSLTACRKALMGMDAKVDGYMADLYSYFQILLNGILRGEEGIPLVEKDILSKDIMASQEFRGARSIPRMLYKILWKFCFFLRPVLDALPSGQIRKDVLAFFFDARFFLTVIEIYFDDSYILSAEAVKGISASALENELTITLSCLDASSKIHKLITDQHSAVFFSATLSPTFYYTSMLIGEKNAMDAKTLTLSSPFPPENLSVGILKTIKTTYQERNFSIEKVAEAIFTVTGGKTGNYLIYLPSFAYLKMLTEVIRGRLMEKGTENVDILAQTPSMNSHQKADFLLRFEQFGSRTLFAFAVLGGHFGEGIDLVGERLSGVLIVGVGLPLLCPEREIMRQYFGEKFGDGFGFAYRFPGWEKVLQAAGRVIRNEEDTGFVFLMDERYEKPEYQILFPEHWHPQIVSDPEEFDLLP